MRILEKIDVEKLIEFLNEIDENHWIIVEWRPDVELGISPSVCAVTKQHLEIFRDWNIKNEQFVWSNEQETELMIRYGHEILEECVFYYDENMIRLYQKLHELNQNFKSFVGPKYDFKKFIEEILESQSSKENSDENENDEDDNEKEEEDEEDDEARFHYNRMTDGSKEQEEIFTGQTEATLLESNENENQRFLDESKLISEINLREHIKIVNVPQTDNPSKSATSTFSTTEKLTAECKAGPSESPEPFSYSSEFEGLQITDLEESNIIPFILCTRK